jgi:hypothetical protein
VRWPCNELSRLCSPTRSATPGRRSRHRYRCRVTLDGVDDGFQSRARRSLLRRDALAASARCRSGEAVRRVPYGPCPSASVATSFTRSLASVGWHRSMSPSTPRLVAALR